MPDPGLATRLYGGRDLDSATNIVFTNGLLDPWSSGGVLKSGEAKGGVVAIIIPEVTTAGSWKQLYNKVQYSVLLHLNNQAQDSHQFLLVFVATVVTVMTQELRISPELTQSLTICQYQLLRC